MNNQKGFPINMRTGSHQYTNDSWANEYINNQMILITVIMEDAVKLAAHYSEAAGRKGVQANDINKGLMLRAYHGQEFWNQPGIQDQISRVREYMENGSDESDSVDDSDDSDKMGEGEEPESWSASTHNCSICIAMNQITDKWDGWNPTSNEEISLKNAINKAIKSDHST